MRTAERNPAKPFQAFAHFLGALVFGTFMVLVGIAKDENSWKSSDEIEWWAWLLILMGIILVCDSFMDWMKEIDKARYQRKEKN